MDMEVEPHTPVISRPAQNIAPAGDISESSFTDLLHWRKPFVSVAVLVSGIFFFIFFRRYHLASFIACNAFLGIIVLVGYQLVKKPNPPSEVERSEAHFWRELFYLCSSQAVDSLVASLHVILAPVFFYARMLLDNFVKAMSFSDIVFSLEVTIGIFVVWMMSRIVSLLVLAFIAFLGVMTIPTLADRFPAQFAAAERYAHSTALLVVGLALNYFRKAKEMVTGKLRPPVALHHD